MFVPRSIGLLAEGSFQDPHNARLLYLASGGLLLLGIVLGVGTWWWWRTSKVEHPALGPLEVMSQRNWRNDDFVSQRRRLDEARPEGALRQFVPPDEIEFESARNEAPAHFDDLAEETAGEVAGEAADEPDSEPDSEPVGEAAPIVIDPLLRTAVEPPVSSVDDTPA